MFLRKNVFDKASINYNTLFKFENQGTCLKE